MQDAFLDFASKHINRKISNDFDLLENQVR